MLTDVAERERAEQCVAQRVDHDVAIRMRDESTFMRDAHAGEHDVVAGTECVYVDALADAHGQRYRAEVAGLTLGCMVVGG